MILELSGEAPDIADEARDQGELRLVVSSVLPSRYAYLPPMPRAVASGRSNREFEVPSLAKSALGASIASSTAFALSELRD